MKILFYLPVVTPWWFETIIGPMLRQLDDEPHVAELHLILAPLWRNTGVEPRHIQPLAGLQKLRLHVVDKAYGRVAFSDFRLDGTRVPGLMDLVQTIAPDLTLARCADFETTRQFPGITRHITEGAAPPYNTDPSWVVLDEQPFCHGHMPDAPDALALSCGAALDGLAAHVPTSTAAQMALPEGRPIVAVPLHYEHEENFYLRHAAFATSWDMIAHLHARLHPDVVLAVTDHPLNRLHLNRMPLYVKLTGLGDRVRLCEADNATAMLASFADAMVSDLSKCWALAAYYGTPILNVGRRPMAGWLHALPALDACPTTPRRTERTAPDAAALQGWYGWHLGGRLLDPALFDLAGLLRRVEGCPNAGDFDANMHALHARIGQMA